MPRASQCTLEEVTKTIDNKLSGTDVSDKQKRRVSRAIEVAYKLSNGHEDIVTLRDSFLKAFPAERKEQGNALLNALGITVDTDSE